MPDVFACPPLLSLPLPLVPAWAQGLNQEHQGSRNRSTAVSLCCPEKRSLVWVGASAAWGRARGERWCPCTPVLLEVFSVGAA
ncbi:mitochondrial peptide methionine sulfoxide reductase isoform X1 [Lates japonicus]|uniref:Mitochondrial peptide methionine sulfoxide reductase isoform X1 n=1 Tax=Lates japonicus TaxID=270547 RepID=A0AAD3QX48_LATJO|nr:mitochondrial peptide methionine sulfoxide reductase isoform X1 [Lates japonicus]